MLSVYLCIYLSKSLKATLRFLVAKTQHNTTQPTPSAPRRCPAQVPLRHLIKMAASDTKATTPSKPRATSSSDWLHSPGGANKHQEPSALQGRCGSLWQRCMMGVVGAFSGRQWVLRGRCGRRRLRGGGGARRTRRVAGSGSGRPGPTPDVSFRGRRRRSLFAPVRRPPWAVSTGASRPGGGSRRRGREGRGAGFPRGTSQAAWDGLFPRDPSKGPPGPRPPAPSLGPRPSGLPAGGGTSSVAGPSPASFPLVWRLPLGYLPRPPPPSPPVKDPFPGYGKSS